MKGSYIYRSIKLIFFALVLLPGKTYSQNIPIGYWRDHLPYNECIDIVKADNTIYCATPYSMFSYNLDDNSIKRITKINGLSDIGISKIAYSGEHEMLVVLYENSNIDLITPSDIFNIPDIKIKTITGDKSLNNLHFRGDYAYVACGFGVVLLDLVKKEIKETYLIGQNSSFVHVKDITTSDDTIYAATKEGLYKASLTAPNLLDFEYWNKDTLIPVADAEYNYIEHFGGRLYMNKFLDVWRGDSLFVFDNGAWNFRQMGYNSKVHDMKIYNHKLVISNAYYVSVFNKNHEEVKRIHAEEFSPGSCIIDENDNEWIADREGGLKGFLNNGDTLQILPNGPTAANNFKMSVSNNNVWVATGAVDEMYHKKYVKKGVYFFDNMTWDTLDVFQSHGADDIITVATDPQQHERVFVGSYGHGLLEIYNNEVINHYGDSLYPFKYVSGLSFDNEGNLWISNYPNQLVRFSNDNKYDVYNLEGLTNSTFVVSSQIVIDEYDQKWILLPRDNSVIVFKDGKAKKLSSNVGDGNLPGTDIKTLAIDKTGEMWIGTNEGIGVIYSPGDVFTGNNFDAERIIIEQDGYAQYLLETSTVTCIAIDGANRKWVGTANSGLYLFSEDGQEEMHHFTEDNSPLFSDNVQCLGINNQTGEVFIGTENGIISYRSDATGGNMKNKNVYAYPNPVEKGYNGPIAIKGLVNNANVKITNTKGELVFEATALGGQAIWDGRNFSGQKIPTGVYLVFSTNTDGSETNVTKILFIQ